MEAIPSFPIVCANDADKLSDGSDTFVPPLLVPMMTTRSRHHGAGILGMNGKHGTKPGVLVSMCSTTYPCYHTEVKVRVCVVVRPLPLVWASRCCLLCGTLPCIILGCFKGRRVGERRYPVRQQVRVYRGGHLQRGRQEGARSGDRGKIREVSGAFAIVLRFVTEIVLFCRSCCAYEPS